MGEPDETPPVGRLRAPADLDGCKITCRTYVLSESEPSLAQVITSNNNGGSLGQRFLGAVDLAIDFATLGEYGLETPPADAGARADEPCRERSGRRTGWEALARARRGDCASGELWVGRRRPGPARAHEPR